jgi:hypothetical protein
MAVTYTQTMEQQAHRLLVVYTDMYGVVSRRYIYASQVASLASEIQIGLTQAQANETAMTAFLVAFNATQAAGAATPAATPSTVSQAAQATSTTSTTKA